MTSAALLTPPVGSSTSTRSQVSLASGRRNPTPELVTLYRTRVRLNRAVWGIAAGVMVYGAVNVTMLLIRHDISVFIAWMLPLMVDLAMCIGLWSDRILHVYGRRNRWVTALRWVTAVMTTSLNIAEPAMTQDWVSVGLHATGPLLLLCVAEAAGSIQHTLTSIISEIEGQEHQSVDQVEGLRRQLAAADDELATVRTSRDQLQAELHIMNDQANASQAEVDHLRAQLRQLHETNIALLAETSPKSETDERDSPDVSATHAETSHSVAGGAGETPDPSSHPSRDDVLTAKELMWRYWRRSREAGETPCGAELDDVAGTNNYGRKVIAQWRAAGLITDEDLFTANRGGRRGRGAIPEPPVALAA